MFHHRRSAAGSEAEAGTSAGAQLAVMTHAGPDPRRRLLDAMVETVALRGYDRTTVSRVLSSAGLEEAMFSEHFYDKHDCFMQAADDLLGRVERDALEQFQQAAPWPERVRLALAEPALCARAQPGRSSCRACGDARRGPRGLRAPALCACPVRRPDRGGPLAIGGYLRTCPPRLPRRSSAGSPRSCTAASCRGTPRGCPELHADLTYFALLPYLDHERALSVARASRLLSLFRGLKRSRKPIKPPGWSRLRRAPYFDGVACGNWLVCAVECERCLLVAGGRRDHVRGVFGIVRDRRVDRTAGRVTALSTARYQAHQLFDDFFADRAQWRPAQRRSGVGAGGAAEHLQAGSERVESARLRVGVGAIGADPLLVDAESFGREHVHHLQEMLLRGTFEDFVFFS